MIDKEKRAGNIDNESTRKLTFHACVSADVFAGSLPFRLSYQYGSKDSAIRLEWIRQPEETLAIANLQQAFEDSPMEFTVHKAIDQFGLQLTKVALSYYFKRKDFEFLLEAKHYGSLRIGTKQLEIGTALLFCLELTGKFYFSELPVLGSITSKSDYIGLKKFILRVNPDHSVQIGAVISLQIAEEKSVIPIGDLSTEAGIQSVNAKHTNNNKKIKWLDNINKDLGPLHLSRLGISMENGCAIVYVDAGIRLSILMLEFIDLYLSIPFQAGKPFDYGIKGMAVTMSKPPLTISGGLYLSGNRKQHIYNGEVTVRFQKLGMTALCSYGEFDNGKPSLFAFLILEANLGGPPAFYVTALAGGFGYNRTIRIPDKIQNVEKFPFVAAAMGKDILKSSMTPAEVLTAMKDDITLENNQYFVSAGIRFTSFGIVESFALLNAEFGTRFRLSLLGLSKLTLPTGSKNPMVYLELGLKMVLAPDDGVFSTEGALSDSSYLLDHNCKVHGGFAFFFWFGKHEHAGDFVITLGGYRNGFRVAHYPQVDRIGVNWKMNDCLNLNAEFYFALIPTGIMMGGQLNLIYEKGRFKAWLRAWAEFFMQWKPFLYNISVGISIGASYRWDYVPFYKTFKVELGADLELWGPPFGGRAHISWWVISLTITFGHGKPIAERVSWDDFSDTFLNKSDVHQNESAKQLINIQASSGVVGKQNRAVLMASDHLRLEVSSQMMCTSVRFGGTEIAKRHDLGILPMKISSLSSILSVQLVQQDRNIHTASHNDQSSFYAEALYQNVPKALWAPQAPAPKDQDTVLKNIPCGVAISCKPKDPEDVLPPRGAYDMDVLCGNELLKPHTYSYTVPQLVTPIKYDQNNWQELIEKSISTTGGIRNKILNELSEICNVWSESEIDVSGWTSTLDKTLYAIPVIKTIGANTETGTLQITAENTTQIRAKAPRLYRIS
ncbi:MAG: hypothetical protein K2J99_02190 [Lachnospiraceae bacterium]|nr:hypothetical protein [Lachnospiraceae bacterium]